MSDETHKDAEEPRGASSTPPGADAPDQEYEVTFRKSSNELVLKDPKSGQSIMLRGRLEETEPDDEEEPPKPLAPDELRAALERLNSIGLTWTADRTPAIKPKSEGIDDPFFTEEFSKIQSQYPHLPSELGLIVAHAITGGNVPAERVGDAEDLKKKAEIVRELLITPEYKSEFFFKHSIKVPYLSGTDWEVVFKLVEKNVAGPPGISYALLSLIYHYPSIGASPHRHQSVTVAVNNEIIDRLIRDLNKLKEALEVGSKLTSQMHAFKMPAEDKDDASTKRDGLD